MVLQHEIISSLLSADIHLLLMLHAIDLNFVRMNKIFDRSGQSLLRGFKLNVKND